MVINGCSTARWGKRLIKQAEAGVCAGHGLYAQQLVQMGKGQPGHHHLPDVTHQPCVFICRNVTLPGFKDVYNKYMGSRRTLALGITGTWGLTGYASAHQVGCKSVEEQLLGLCQ